MSCFYHAGGSHRPRISGQTAAQQNELRQRFIELFTGLNDLLEYLQINREVCAW